METDIDTWLSSIDPELVAILVKHKYLLPPYDRVPSAEASIDEKLGFRWRLEAALDVWRKDHPKHETSGFP